MEDEDEIIVPAGDDSATLDEYGDPITSAEPEDEEEDETVDVEDEDEDEEEEEESEPEVKPEPDKPAEKVDKNAAFAQRRRDQEAAVQAKIDAAKTSTLEYQLATRIANMYGVSVEDLQKQLDEADLKKRAETEGIPIEVAQRLHKSEQAQSELQNQLVQMQFATWKNRVQAEQTALHKDLPMLTDADMESAQTYLLTVLRNPEASLESAVYALHGKKIIDHERKQSKTEAIAEVTNRKKGAPPASGAKPSAKSVLTDDEKAIAKAFGMSDSEYIKWK